MDEANEIASEDYDYWGAMERAVNETDVLRAIYGVEHDDNSNSNSNDADADADGGSAGAHNAESSKFGIVSPGREEMKRIRKKLGLFLFDDDDVDCLDSNCNEVQQSKIPELRIEIQIRMDIYVDVDDNDDEENNSNNTVVFRGISTVQFLLSLGYPEYSSAVVTSIRMKSVTTMTSISSFSLTRSVTDEIVRILNKKSDSLLGTESILDLMEDAKDLISDHCRREISSLLQRQQMRKQLQDNTNRSTMNNVDFGKHNGRRWIWVHHITSSDRKKSIVREARELNLTGILKYGYPGVVLIEGTIVACDEFTSWIKGNKSIQGGFGRNWGHHVRGEINFELELESSTTMMKLFEEIEDLSIMAKAWKEMGLEDEFKVFVMQHK
ncbi:hypothetical protein FRACYDRAFT_239882 [Fragilariopsis cylindrus CCMP1102]|uniref:Small nuclear ribonucleoprotein Prp3 C-terminal domain-containing protein n=1 Tax=Fragilariopsis cylindrus CCMP1102 TaxID=635003 RepID=A0A1E7FAN7_9STRA|nr:hypothetical protein FRACYDRAFT_239882 [Fragilariopsis cylindrus CCMP1102]|eukprot:OEU15206.1 hypothetical protein FRACYDRAFT_239882 [Fragilariopsis cylindrus CCMP1102]